MRWALSAILVAGCATSTPSPGEKEPTYEARLDELLRIRPDDPDLLFLRHDHKDLVRCRRLAELRPTPLVYASVISNHLSSGVDEENLSSFEQLLVAWQSVDPENAMPIILKGLTRIARGNLSAGVQVLVQASQLPALRTYGNEMQQETLRLQKQEDLVDVWHIKVFLDDIQLARTVLGVSRLFRALSTWEFLDGNKDGSTRMSEADYRIASLFQRDARSRYDGLVLSTLVPYSAERMCELALMNQDAPLAARYALVARNAWIEDRTRSLAAKRYLLADPVTRIMLDLAKPEAAGDPVESEDLDNLLNGIFESTRTSTDSEEFHQALNEHSDEIREHIEAEIVQGYLAASSASLTLKDRNWLQSLEPPIDQFMVSRDDFYPVAYGPGHRKRLIELLTVKESGAESEVRGFLRERAANALNFHKDANALPFLSEDYLILRVALGERLATVGEGFKEAVSSVDPSACWAAARLRLTELIPDLLLSLYLDTGPSSLCSGFSEAVNALLALRVITGQEFGLDADRWIEWGKSEGYWKDR